MNEQVALGMNKQTGRLAHDVYAQNLDTKTVLLSLYGAEITMIVAGPMSAVGWLFA